HQADKLGIELTDAEVIREVNRAAGNPSLLDPDEPWERNRLVQKFAAPADRERRAAVGASAPGLLQALREGFRVQLAKEALLGHGTGVWAFRNEAEPVRMSPAAATPDEFLNYFRDQRTTLNVRLLPVEVSQFLDQVKGEPTVQELENRYETYK